MLAAKLRITAWAFRVRRWAVSARSEEPESPLKEGAGYSAWNHISVPAFMKYSERLYVGLTVSVVIVVGPEGNDV